MAKVSLKMGVKVKRMSMGLFRRRVKEHVETDPRFMPKTVRVETPYALYIEFGSGPASGRKAQTATGSVRKEIERWVEVKLGIADPKKRHRVAGAIYHNLMENGMLPQPFMRPAIERVSQDLGRGYLKRDGSTQEVAEMLVEEMRAQLEAHDTLYTGEISRNMRIYDGHLEPSEKQRRIPENIWAEEDLAYDGRRVQTRYRR